MSFISNRAKLPSYHSPPQMRKDLFSEPTGKESGDMREDNGMRSFSDGAPLLHPSPPLVPNSAEDPLAGALLGVSQVVTKLAITHPCMVLRRQCQVHQHARSLHLTPVTLVPVVFNMIGQHGISTFWRGSIGYGVLWGLSTVTEVVISDLFGLPRTLVERGSQGKYWRHILLKGSTFFLMTPFYISSFIETVRSGQGLAGGEDNRVMEVLVKGVQRMKYLVFGPRDHSRKLSILHLAIPTVAVHTSHYIIQAALYTRLYAMAKDYVNRKPAVERTKLHELIPQMFASVTSVVLTDIIVFPFETILHRLYVQGTRTLIDDMDTGVLAISMKVKYDGFFDCFKTIVSTEGVWALYAGIGAVFLEYGLQSCLHQLVRACFDRGSQVVRSSDLSSVVKPPLDPSFAPLPSSLSPISSPRRNPVSISSPPRNPSQYPSFGELSVNDPLAQFAAQTGKPLDPLFLRTDDPFNSQFGH